MGTELSKHSSRDNYGTIVHEGERKARMEATREAIVKWQAWLQGAEDLYVAGRLDACGTVGCLQFLCLPRYFLLMFCLFLFYC